MTENLVLSTKLDRSSQRLLECLKTVVICDRGIDVHVVCSGHFVIKVCSFATNDNIV